MCKQISVIFVVLSLVFLRSANGQNTNCTTPAGQHGRCLGVNECPFVLDLLRTGVSVSDHEYMTKFRCGQKANGAPLVCCPELRSAEVCGLFTIQDNIFGGSETEPDEFPWMAVLEIKDEHGDDNRCGGSLINDQFVVTAAHCVHRLSDLNNIQVRLGDWDLSNTSDCKDERCFEDKHMVFGVEKVIIHEKYKKRTKEHDIALLKLQSPAPTTDTISPICVPTQEMDDEMNINRIFHVAGWGFTEHDELSNTKKKVSLQGRNMTVCREAFDGISSTSFTTNQLCVGGDEGKDSCRGDSGGPLMTVLNKRWSLVGIVSSGLGCGFDGYPGVYTRFGKYLRWVANRIELASRTD